MLHESKISPLMLALFYSSNECVNILSKQDSIKIRDIINSCKLSLFLGISIQIIQTLLSTLFVKCRVYDFAT